MHVRLVIAVLAITLLSSPAIAGAVPRAATSATATVSQPTTRSYDLDFTLPTTGKSGCLVCHGDPSLLRVGFESTSSIYVDMDVLNASAHSERTPCTGCHLDFAYTSPHKQVEADGNWEMAARAACKNCHKEAFTDYANGAHSPAGQPGVEASVTAAQRKAEGKPSQVPLCGDCHGGHSIPATDNVEARRVVQLSGVEMCGKPQCHEAAALNYDDYYHGAAYRAGSLDAPSCWDCHGFHNIIPASERTSPVHASRLSETCGQQGCHTDADDESFLEYASLIHGQHKIQSENPVISVVDRLKSSVSSVFRLLFAWL